MRVVELKENYVPIVIKNNKIIICYDKEYPFGQDSNYISFYRESLPIHTSFEGIQRTIINQIKKDYSDRISKGFSYDDNHFITLSDYDQENFNRLYSLSNLNTLYPLTLNIGRSEDQHTITFNNKEEFTQFMSTVNSFIESMRRECREVLAAINWNDYKI